MKSLWVFAVLACCLSAELLAETKYVTVDIASIELGSSKDYAVIRCKANADEGESQSVLEVCSGRRIHLLRSKYGYFKEQFAVLFTSLKLKQPVSLVLKRPDSQYYYEIKSVTVRP